MSKKFSLLHNDKVIISNGVFKDSLFGVSFGLMFASFKRVVRGICLKIPDSLFKRSSFCSSVTMLFCFYPYEILFLDESFIVVDKVVLKPFRLSYVPKAKAKYIVESSVGRFEGIEIGDKVLIEVKC